MKLIADAVRLSWPEAIIYANDAPDTAMCNMRKDNTSVFSQAECLPVNIDWWVPGCHSDHHCFGDDLFLSLLALPLLFLAPPPLISIF